MTTEEKIDKLLQLFQEERELNVHRFAGIDNRFQQIDIRFQEIDNRFQQVDIRFQEIDNRFQQVDIRFQGIDNRFQEIDSRLYGIDCRFDRLERELKGEINKVFMTLSQDIQVFAIDLEKVKRRVDRIEKKIA